LSLGLDDGSQQVYKSVDAVTQGVINGLSMDQKELTAPIQNTISQIVAAMQSMDSFDGPVITPVLDLSKVQSGAKQVGSLLDAQAAYSQAVAISSSALSSVEGDEASVGVPREVKYEQNIYAPEQLSTADIYRATKSQITIAKEELNLR